MTPSRLALSPALALLVLGTCPLAASAQVVPNRVVPPSRPDQQPRAEPSSAPASRAAKPQTRPRVAPFILKAVVVEGSTLPAPEFDSAWRPLVGRTFAQQDLVQITDALAAVYDRHDVALYTLAIEDQDLTGGVVHVRAFEGHLERIEVTGTTGRPRALVDRHLARMSAERPLRRSTLERRLSLIRDLPGLTATPVLVDGATDTGVVLQLDLRPAPVQVAASINNRGTALLGRTQVGVDLYLNSLLRDGDQTRFSVAVPNDVERFRYVAIQRSDPIGADGWVMSLSASYLRTRPKGLGIVGHATAAGLQLSHPLVRSYERDIYVTFGLDGVDNDNSFLGFTFADDRTRTLRTAISYSRQGPRRLTYASATLSQGVDGLGARTTAREFAEADFTKLNGRAGASFALGAQGALRLNGIAQASNDRLPATEQFSLGGEDFGRALPAAAIAGDEGVAASAELAYAPARLPALLQGSEGYVFADAGKVWYRARLGAPSASARLASAGFGVRAKVSNRILVQLEAANALKNPAPGFIDGGWRGIFAIRSVF